MLDPATFISSPPRNTFINIVPQGSEFVVERLGKYRQILKAGVHYLNPFIDRIRYAYSTKEQSFEIPFQSATTRDNVFVEVNGVVFLRVADSYKASYNVENPIYNVINLAQTILRNEISRLSLERLFLARSTINGSVQEIVQKEAAEWGVECKRYEMKEIGVSDVVRRSMDLQAEAERQKRKTILDSEGIAIAEENRACGLRNGQKHAAEALHYAVKRRAEAEAEALRIRSAVEGEHITRLAKILEQEGEVGEKAANIFIAEEYLSQMGKFAKKSNTVIADIPTGNPASLTSRILQLSQLSLKQRRRG